MPARLCFCAAWRDCPTLSVEMAPVILHIDMDAFFAQIEQVANPELRGKPVIVGGDFFGRGVVATCSYEARKYGIHSAMPASKARKLCPHAIFVNGHYSSYTYISSQIIEILLRFTPLVEATSIDEAYLDISDSLNLYGDPIETAKNIKDAIYSELQLTCSIGISENRLLAKTASDMNKPDGLTTLFKNEIEEKFFPLAIRKLRGVGPQTEEVLKKWGIETIRDLADFPQDRLEQTFGVYGLQLKKKALGEASSHVTPIDEAEDEKSISNEHTLHEDSSDLVFVRSLLMTLSDKVASRMKKAGFLAKTIRLKLRFSNFKTITREKTIDKYTDNPETIFTTLSAMIPDERAKREKVRLIGAGVTSLKKIADSPQFDLFGQNSMSRRTTANDTVEEIRKKHGRFSIVRAVSLPFKWDR